MKIGGENRPEWIMERHWKRFAEEIKINNPVIQKRLSSFCLNLVNQVYGTYADFINRYQRKALLAVIIQELIPSDRSGIFFGINPSNSTESVIESVYGLNQALVDGDVEPDRWILKQSSGKILSHIEPIRKLYALPDKDGIYFADLSEESIQTPPLADKDVLQIWETGIKLERLFDRHQDIEWTFCNNQLIILQSRPITTAGFKKTDDKRTWYLTLHRSYENLKKLYDKIENHLIPEMIREAKRLGQANLQTMTTKLLCHEIEQICF